MSTLSLLPQKSRVALARVTWTRPHILLLDEPSNHLDIDAVEALIQARRPQVCGLFVAGRDG